MSSNSSNSSKSSNINKSAGERTDGGGKAAKRVYAGNAVFAAAAAWFAYRPLYVGFQLVKGLSGEAVRGEVFVGALIWLCVLLMLFLAECAVYYSFRFCKLRKGRFAAYGGIAFLTVVLLRIAYSVLQSWVS